MKTLKQAPLQKIIHQQYKTKVNALRSIKIPAVANEGWIRTIRKALDMSGSQLGKKLGTTRNKISILERKEVSGDITLNQLQSLAEGVNASLVYTIVPNKEIDTMIDERAKEIALETISMSNQNMSLESQQLSPEKLQQLLNETQILIKNKGGRVLWESSINERQK